MKDSCLKAAVFFGVSTLLVLGTCVGAAVFWVIRNAPPGTRVEKRLMSTVATARMDWHSSTHQFRTGSPLESVIVRNINGKVSLAGSDDDAACEVKTRYSLRTLGVEAPDETYDLRPELQDRQVILDVEAVSRNWRAAEVERADIEVVAGRNVPAQVTLTNGSVRIEGMSAPVEIKVVNGGIDLTAHGAGAVAETVNGNVTYRGAVDRITLLTVNGNLDVALSPAEGAGGSRVRMETVNGNITMEVPAGMGVSLDLTGNNIRVEGDRALTETGRSTNLGLVTGLQGRLGDGAVSVQARTGNGMVRVKAP